MTQDEITRMAREAGLQPYYDEQVAAIARFAAIVAATEREKCTNTQEFVKLPREVVEQAIRSLERYCFDVVVTKEVHAALRTALDQPQNHVPDARNMVPAGWKLVPVEPTDDMEAAAETDYEQFNGGYFPDWLSAYRAMLAAAPQPPTTEDCSVVLPQANQQAMTPIAQRKLDSLLAEGYTISGYSIYHKQKHQHGFVTGAGLVGWWKPEGMEYPQPKGEHEAEDAACRCEPTDWYPPADYGGDGSVDALARQGTNPHQPCQPTAVKQPPGAQEPIPNGATHIQPRQGAFYKRVDGKWYVWSIMKNGEPRRWYISPGTAESCLEPLATTPQPKREPLTDEQILGFGPGQEDAEWTYEDQLYFARAIENAHNIK